MRYQTLAAILRGDNFKVLIGYSPVTVKFRSYFHGVFQRRFVKIVRFPACMKESL